MEPVGRKEELLHRIAVALRGHEANKPASGAAAGRETAQSVADRIARFRNMFESQGGNFLAGPSLDPLLPELGEALRIAGVNALFSPPGDERARMVAETLVPFGPFRLASPGEIRQISAPSAAGFQTAEFAIAETGSIVQSGQKGKTLLPGLISDVHVALLTPDAFVDSMDQCLAALSEDLPRNISFITGPSRTADIEQTLTIGAHGPKKVIAVLLP